jgi:hypothetical protein
MIEEAFFMPKGHRAQNKWASSKKWDFEVLGA